MASSNRHWPSMFKSKPCNPHHQWQHDINSSLMSIGCHRSPYDTPAAGSCDERNPEPKPRWNPKPEQIRILEAIFNSGMVNPPRDEIRKIRMQLQEYGQVGDANVFYWFQNRKSRSKHKLRHLQNSSKNMTPEQQAQENLVSLPQNTAPSSSSSSSSEKSSPKDKILPTNKGFSIGFTNINGRVPNSPTPSASQTYFQTYNETNLLPHASEPFFFPLHHNGEGMVDNAIPTQGFCFSDLSNVIQPHHPQQNIMPCTSTMMLSEVRNYGSPSKKDQYQEKAVKIMHQHTHPSFYPTSTPITSLAATVAPPITNTTVTVPSPIPQLQGVGDAAGTERATVFINDVAFEIPVGPLNVREAFGDQAVLLYSSGHPVPTDEWGVTLQSLHHGASYYLI